MVHPSWCLSGGGIRPLGLASLTRIAARRVRLMARRAGGGCRRPAAMAKPWVRLRLRRPHYAGACVHHFRLLLGEDEVHFPNISPMSHLAAVLVHETPN